MKIDVNVPDGQSGNWRVDSYEVTKQEAEFANLRAAFGRPLEYVKAGIYKRLMRGNTVVMSNTSMEVRTNRPIIHSATGNVLINGLGLGMVLAAILAKPEVTGITVVEKSEDVIKLVAPTYNDPRVTIVHADALLYKPKEKYQSVWHDIWDFICGDNLSDMHKLHRKYGRLADWQGSWCRYECERAR